MADSQANKAAGRLAVLHSHLTGNGNGNGNDFQQNPVGMGFTSSWGANTWSHIPMAPPDAILGITENWRADPHPNKLNLGVGAYRTEEGKPLVLDVVKKAEMSLVLDPTQIKEYLGIGGNPEFCRLSRALAFGSNCRRVQEGCITTVHCLSGTGSLRVGGEFLTKHYPVKSIYLPQPTWGNHRAIFTNAGLQVRNYRYYHPPTRGLDFEGLAEDLNRAENGAVVILHACAHNPTGVDPTIEQWGQILQIVQRKRLLAFFDSAYQGFASGDLDTDAASVRMFANSGVDMMLAQSYSKNLGLYGERTGALSVACQTAKEAKHVESQLKTIIRPMYSNPPRHGAAIVATVLGSPDLFQQWKVELRGMATRIMLMRKKLHEALNQRGTPGDWSHILKQIGMFSYTGLTKPQVQHMTHKWHVYMTLDGRISMAGLSAKKCGYLADAMDDAVRNVRG